MSQHNRSTLFKMNILRPTIVCSILQYLAILKGTNSFEGLCSACPEDKLTALSNIHGKHCVRECPSDASFVFKCSCTEKCPKGFTENRNGNVKFCSSEIDNYSTRICIINECNEPSPFCYNLRCLQKCPPFTVHYGNNCVIECLKDRPYIHNTFCVDNCPIDFPFLEYGVCVSNCSAGFFLSGINCVQKCARGQYVEENRCVSKCYGFILHTNNAVMCLEECPNLTIKNNNSCDFRCPDNKPFFFNNKCKEMCPSTFPLILKIKSPYEQRDIMVCSENCPQYISQNNLCTESCQSDEVLYQNECRYRCPESDPYRTHLSQLNSYISGINTTFTIHRPIRANSICTMECPKTFVFDIDGCFSDCFNSTRQMEYNGTCINTCPENAPYMQRFYSRFICTNRCPEVQHKNICQTNCPTDAPFNLNGNCTTKCSSDFPYKLNKNVFENYEYVCVEKCPKYRNDNACVEFCPQSRKYVYNGQCTDCISLGKFIKPLEHRCVDKCPNVTFDGECFDVCPPNARYNFNGSCKHSCRGKLPLINVDIIETIYQQIVNVTCVDKCPKGKFKSSNICVEFCSDMFEYNDTCVHKCPLPKPYSMSNTSLSRVFDATHTIKNNFNLAYFEFPNIKHCVPYCPNVQYNMTCYDICPDGKVSLEGSCVSECKGKYLFKDLHSCVESCPKYVMNFTCFKTCPTGTFLYNTTCVFKCPETLRYNQLGKCVSLCPKYFNNLMTCINTCPGNKFLDGMFCSENCPRSRPYYTIDFDNRKTCYSSCPELLQANGINKCIYEYECEFYIYKGRCLQECPLHTYAHQLEFKPYRCVSLTPVYVLIPIFGVLMLLFLLMVVRLLIHTKHLKKDLHSNEQESLHFFEDECHETVLKLPDPENTKRRIVGKNDLVDYTNETFELHVYQPEYPMQMENDSFV